MYYLATDLTFMSTPDARDEQFEAFLDCVMAELERIGHPDADLAASLTARTAEILMGVVADTFEDAAIIMLSDLRTALHAAQCCTPDWPLFERRGGAVRTVEVPDAKFASA